MRASLLVGATFLLLSCVPAAWGQAHEHGDASGPRILLQSDLPPDGRAWVGHPAHFEYLLLDAEDAVILHHDISVAVKQNGVLLYATDSGHDYDGVGGLDITFPVAGPFEVTVTVGTSGGMLEAHYFGTAVPIPDAVPASIKLEAPTTAAAGAPVSFTYSIVDEAGVLIPHTDVRVEIRRIADDFPVLDVHTHSHEDAQSFSYRFEKAGTHEVRFVGYQAYPDKAALAFTPALLVHTIDVAEGAPTAPGVPRLVPPVDEGHGSHGIETPFRSHILGDPVTGQDGETGPFAQVRTTMATYNTSDDMLVQHINYEAELSGPAGVVFQSASLHEYDGALTLMSANQVVGTYTWTIQASRGSWEETRRLSYDVKPVALPQGAGPQFLDVTGLDAIKAGEPADVGFFAHGPGVVPFMHSEIAVQVRDAAGLPLLAHKLHTHSDGRFAMTYTAPAAGDHVLQADLFDIHGSPTPVYYGSSPGQPTRYAFTAAEGTPLPVGEVVETDDVPVEPEQAPAPAMAVLLVVALGVVAAVRRVRSR